MTQSKEKTKILLQRRRIFFIYIQKIEILVYSCDFEAVTLARQKLHRNRLCKRAFITMRKHRSSSERKTTPIRRGGAAVGFLLAGKVWAGTDMSKKYIRARWTSFFSPLCSCFCFVAVCFPFCVCFGNWTSNIDYNGVICSLMKMWAGEEGQPEQLAGLSKVGFFPFKHRQIYAVSYQSKSKLS